MFTTHPNVLVLCAAFALMGLCVQAQPVDLPMANEDLQKCLLRSGAATWEHIGLSPDQTERVRRVQEACERECSVQGAKKEENPISTENGRTILKEIQGILSADQYRAWVARCAEGGEDAR